MVKPKNSKLRLRKQFWSLYLDDGPAEALRKYSKETRIPAQEFLREGLDLVLKKYKVPVKKERKK
jgi:hypothetical protein